MSVKKTKTTRRSGRPDSPFKGAIDLLLKYPRTRVGALKDMIYSDFQVSTKGYNDYYNTLEKGTQEAEELHKILNQLYNDSTDTPFYKYSQKFMEWNNKYKKGMHPHHSEYSNIASQLRAIYEGLLDIQEDPALKFGQQDGKNALVFKGGQAPYGPANRDPKTNVDTSKLADFRGTLNSLLPKAIESFRQLYIIALAISRETNIQGDFDVDNINTITQSFIDGLDQAEYDIIKRNHVHVMSGKAKMEVEIVSEDINKLLGKYEGQLGKYSQMLLRDGTITDSDFAKVQKQVDFSKLKGSKAIKGEMERQIADLITKGRTTPSKSNSKMKRKVSSKKRKATKINKQNSRAVTRPKGRAVTGAEDGNALNSQALLRLRRAINRRLPAEVRRNMGRPTLINRSGTFSNSVELLDIKQAKTGLTGDYTYMKSGGGTPPRTGQRGVYQTFESHGRWGNQYDPRDLIKTSIRKLAMEMTEQKFVQLRRH